MTVRVLVVDDHPLYLEGLETAISTMPDMTVVACATTGEQAVHLATELEPDVVLMDLHMPGIGGIEATRHITANRRVAVLVLTMLEGDESVFAAMRAGARGYLLKGADRAEIGRAVIGVANGEVMFSAGIAHRVLAFFAASSLTSALTPFPQLTDREHEVLDLVARGLTNPEIARQLTLSAKTVRNHVSNVFTKLSVNGRAEAIVHARDAGIGVQPTRHRRG